MSILNFMWANRSDVWRLTIEHLVMVAIAIVLATAIGIPVGILMTRNPRLSRPILAVANIVQTIPSLALFGFLIPMPYIGGIGGRMVFLELQLCSLLLVIR